MTEERDSAESMDLPFSRPLAVADVPEEGLALTIAAEPAERAALARINGLVALTRLEARLEVTREGRGGLRVAGTLRAEARRTCVATLEEFDAVLEEPITLRFAPEAAPEPPEPAQRASRRRRETSSGRGEDRRDEEPRAILHIADLDEDAPDPIVDGRIDLGSVVAEFLALGLDPYPRKPGARFTAPEAEPRPASPFLGLRAALGKDSHD